MCSLSPPHGPAEPRPQPPSRSSVQPTHKHRDTAPVVPSSNVQSLPPRPRSGHGGHFLSSVEHQMHCLVPALWFGRCGKPIGPDVHQPAHGAKLSDRAAATPGNLSVRLEFDSSCGGPPSPSALASHHTTRMESVARRPRSEGTVTTIARCRTLHPPVAGASDHARGSPGRIRLIPFCSGRIVGSQEPSSQATIRNAGSRRRWRLYRTYHQFQMLRIPFLHGSL